MSASLLLRTASSNNYPLPLMLNRISHLAFASCIAIFLFACGASSAADNAIVIGQAIDLSGPDSSLGRDYVAGIKTYFDTVNSAGGINGKRIRYLTRDDRGEAELTAKAASELIENERADYLLGGIGEKAVSAVLATAAFRRSGHVLFSPLAANEYNDTRVLFLRPSYKQEVAHIFSHFSKLGMKDLGIVYQEAAANTEAYRMLTTEAEARGMTIAASARMEVGGDRIAQEAQRLAGMRPGFILVLADTIGTALFLKEYRKHGGTSFVAGTSLTNLTTLRELAGAKAVEWTVFSQVVPNPGAGTSPLQVEHLNMMRKFRDEEVSSLTLEGFAAAKALVRAIRHARQAGPGGLQEYFSQAGTIDLGGLAVDTSRQGNRLSTYLDIALFKKGGGLMF
jgi:branched-chain amino acid transport system substrate-binding protein